MYGSLLCFHALYHMCAVLEEARRGCRIPLNWSYSTLLCRCTDPPEPSLQTAFLIQLRHVYVTNPLKPTSLFPQKGVASSAITFFLPSFPSFVHFPQGLWGWWVNGEDCEERTNWLLIAVKCHGSRSQPLHGCSVWGGSGL